MIRKVIRGDNIGRTIHYLFGPGRHNEHTNPHLIAAWDTGWLDDPALVASLTTAKGRAKLIAALDAPRVLHEVQVPGGHVYHVPLSIPAEDGLLGDGRWRQVVEVAMDRLGFNPDAAGRGGCRWVAVHHGLSTNGNDHVHVVVQLVRGDGRIANLYRDWPKWDAVCQAAEHRWNLTRTRRAGAGERPLSRAEVERAKRTGQQLARRKLAHRVRAAAAAASSEVQFLAELRGCGVLVEPRISDERVVGYRVALAADEEQPLWLSGSQLHRDLSLPRLRARWDPVDPRWDRYLTQVWLGELDMDATRETGSGLGWRTAVRMLTTATDEIRQLEPTDTQAWTLATSQTADLVAVLARRLEPEPGPLHQAGQHLARAAQPDRNHRRPPTPRPAGRPLLVDVARLVAYSRDPAQTAAIAATVLLVYGLVLLLDRIAAQHQADAAVRQQLKLAGDRIAEHASVAKPATAPTTGQAPAPRHAPVVRQSPMAEIDHLRRAGRAEPGNHSARRTRRP